MLLLAGLDGRFTFLPVSRSLEAEWPNLEDFGGEKSLMPSWRSGFDLQFDSFNLLRCTELLAIGSPKLSALRLLT